MKNIPLKKNTYTDGGYRFVLNNYFRQDKWYKIDAKEKYNFLSISTFNHDVYRNTNADWDQETIAKYYFRLDIDVFTHSRALYSVMDLMSDVGGTSKAIMFTLVLTLGGASFFSSRVEMMLHLYSDKGLFKYFDLADLTDKDSKTPIKRCKSHSHAGNHSHGHADNHGHSHAESHDHSHAEKKEEIKVDNIEEEFSIHSSITENEGGSKDEPEEVMNFTGIHIDRSHRF